MFLGSLKPASKDLPVAASASTAIPSTEAAPAAPPAEAAITSNVKVTGGVEFIEINAKGGYQPALTIAKANLPVVIQFNTNGTFDCSSVVVIPSLNYRARLPMTGSTNVPMPSKEPGTELQGMCSMGMYSFKIKFAG